MAEHQATGGVATIAPPLEYAIVIEAGPPNYSAYVPDLPGCVATGRTVEEVTRRMRKAITMHLAGMQEDGEPIPEPRTRVAIVTVDTPPAPRTNAGDRSAELTAER